MPLPGLVHGSYATIAAELASRLRRERGSNPADWLASPVEIIVASRSAAEEIARLLLADGQGLAGISLHSPERLAVRILNDRGEYPRAASDAECSLAMELACRATKDPLSETHGITSMLLRSWRDVRDSGVSGTEIRHRIARESALRDPRRSLAVSTIWQKFESLLASTAATDQADIFDRAARAVSAGAAIRPQIVFGFYDATGVQMRLFDALAAARKIESIYLPVLLDPSTSLPDERFEFAIPFVKRTLDWGVATPERCEERGPLPEWSIRSFPSPQTELRETCRAIRALLDNGTPPREIAVTARAISDVDAKLLRAAGARFSLTFNGLPGRPVQSNRVVRGVLKLLELQSRSFLRRDVLEIVRAGLRPGVLGKLPTLDALELATRRAEISRGGAAEVRVAAERARYDSREADPALLDYAALVGKLETATRQFGGQRSGAQWADSLLQLSELFAIETEADIAAAGAIRATADSLRSAPFSGNKIDAESVARLLGSAGDLPDSDPDGAIWCGDVMRLRGRSVRHLFAIRSLHDVMPQRRVEDALLPDSDRERLGLRAVGDGREEERLLFAILASSASEAIHSSYPVGDGLGRSLRPSQFLKDFAIERLPDKRREILKNLAESHSESSEESGLAGGAPPDGSREVSGPNPSNSSAPPLHPDSSLRSEWLRVVPLSSTEARTGALLDQPDAMFIRKLQLQALRGTGSVFDGHVTPGAELASRLGSVFERISPSKFEQLGECPHRFFVVSVLGTREVEEPEPNVQIEIRKKGLVDHEVLQLLYESLDASDWIDLAATSRPGLTPRIETKLRAAIDSAFDKLDREFPPLNARLRRIERDEAAHLLAAFAREDLHGLASERFRPKRYELSFDAASPEARIMAGDTTVAFQGRVDRVDAALDGDAHRVIDYKSGKGSHFEKLEKLVLEGKRLQLPIYAIVASQIFGIERAKMTAAIRPLRLPGASLTKFGLSLANVDEGLSAILATLTGAASAGHFPAIPSEDACGFCIISNWCRTRHDSREARASADAGGVLEQLGGARS